MPIGGFVVTIDVKEKERILTAMQAFSEVEIHGVDPDGNVVVVIDTQTADAMDTVSQDLQKIDGVLSVGLTYFHAEDEIEKIESGEIKPSLSFGRKSEKQADRS